jgi:virginiamycin B lyase
MRTTMAMIVGPVVAAILLLAGWPTQGAEHGDAPAAKEWEIEWGGRTRDPYVAPDGKVWFVGQAGNYVATFDPRNGDKRRYEIEEGTNPHTVIVDDDGYAWYAGNRNGRIGRIDPESGELTIFMTGEAADPHTMVFDGQGHIWFTSQHSNRVGRLDMESGDYQLVEVYDTRARPYGIVLDEAGYPWVALFNTNKVIRVHPETLELTYFNKATEESRGRRLETTSGGYVWYVDEPRGYLGRITVASGDIEEFKMPGGDDSRPYAITKDDQERLWISQTGPDKKVAGFDTRSNEFVSVQAVSETVRHMMFHEPEGAMWFGTDANRIGRILVNVAAE